MQTMLEESFAKETKVSRLMAYLVASKLEAQGATGMSDRIDELEREIERWTAAGDECGLAAFKIDDGSSHEKTYNLDFSDEELNAYPDHCRPDPCKLLERSRLC